MSVRTAALTSSLVFLALAAQVLFAFSHMHEVVQPLFAAFLCTEAICLWLRKRWAIKAARWVWGLIIALAVFGCLVNPFFWHEFPANSEPFGLFLPAIYLVMSFIGIVCWRSLYSPAAAT